jgi:hypothetical protein
MTDSTEPRGRARYCTTTAGIAGGNSGNVYPKLWSSGARLIIMEQRKVSKFHGTVLPRYYLGIHYANRAVAKEQTKAQVPVVIQHCTAQYISTASSWCCSYVL